MMKIKTYTLHDTKDLYDELTRTKAELHELVKTLGIVHELTVAKSQELDLVINEYMTQVFTHKTTKVHNEQAQIKQ